MTGTWLLLHKNNLHPKIRQAGTCTHAEVRRKLEPSVELGPRFTCILLV
jgi:hypothetical protein